MRSKQCLGIDIGGTSTKYAFVDENGVHSEIKSFPTGSEISTDEFLKKLFEIVDEAIFKGVTKIGIGTVGVVDENDTTILSGVDNLPMLKGLNFRERLTGHASNLSVYVCNDVEAAARGELWVGSAKKAKSFYYITLGTGLGGAYFLNGKPIRGERYRAGELAYLDYVAEGNYLETSLSTHHVMLQAAKQLGKDSINGFEFFDLVRKQDSIAIAVLNEWIERLASMISNLMIILDPEMIVLGGGISNERDILLEPLRKRIAEKQPLEFREDYCAFDLAALGSKTGIIGAASQCIDM